MSVRDALTEMRRKRLIPNIRLTIIVVLVVVSFFALLRIVNTVFNYEIHQMDRNAQTIETKPWRRRVPSVTPPALGVCEETCQKRAAFFI